MKSSVKSAPSVVSVLLQRTEIGPVVDVIDGAAEGDGGDAFDTGLLGLADAAGGFAEVDDFHFEAGRVEGGGEGLLGIDTDRAAGVVEGGVLFHRFGWFGWSWICV